MWFDCDNKCSIDSWIKMIPNRSGNELMGFFIAFSLSKFHNLNLKMLKYCETHPSLLGLAAWWISFTKWLIWSENLAIRAPRPTFVHITTRFLHLQALIILAPIVSNGLLSVSLIWDKESQIMKMLVFVRTLMDFIWYLQP